MQSSQEGRDCTQDESETPSLSARRAGNRRLGMMWWSRRIDTAEVRWVKDGRSKWQRTGWLVINESNRPWWRMGSLLGVGQEESETTSRKAAGEGNRSFRQERLDGTLQWRIRISWVFERNGDCGWTMHGPRRLLGKHHVLCGSRSEGVTQQAA